MCLQTVFYQFSNLVLNQLSKVKLVQLPLATLGRRRKFVAKAEVSRDIMVFKS